MIKFPKDKKPNTSNLRRKVVIAAAILSAAAVLYLGGLLAQLRTGYQIWLAAGGITGQSLMPSVSWNPLRCWQSVFTPAGLRSILLLLALAGGVVLYVKLHDRFGGKNPDERNFSRSDRGTYGTAGWMGDAELRAVLEVSSPAKARGIILGKRQSGDLICLPEDTRLNKHIAVFGASGTMKSRGVIRPALFQSIRRGESVVVTDPKSGATRS